MMQRRVLATIACCVIVLATASSASAAPNEKPPRCNGGGALLTEDQAIAQKIFQEGIEGGFFTEDELREGFRTFDDNGNGLVCFKPLPGKRFVLPHPFRIGDDR
jgi:hypothetical protein